MRVEDGDDALVTGAADDLALAIDPGHGEDLHERAERRVIGHPELRQPLGRDVDLDQGPNLEDWTRARL